MAEAHTFSYKVKNMDAKLSLKNEGPYFVVSIPSLVIATFESYISLKRNSAIKGSRFYSNRSAN
jgi:hypothetical protein